ncbi:MAG: trypsin-like serine peptidase [Marmoricola sp.]
MHVLRTTVAAILLVAMATLAPTAAQADTPRAPDGVLFYPSVGGLLPLLQAPHFCSASVVHSAGHDLVATAAHCLYGTGATIEFVPGFHDGQAPYGVWTVTALYVESAWQLGQSPQADVAFLRVAPLNGRQIEDVVGGRPLGAPVVNAPVTVSGFPMQSTTPSVCTARLTLTQGYPSVVCPQGGMVDGVSGGAWVQAGALVGVVGGLQQGGCSADVAYSAPFGASTVQLWRRAQAGGLGDLVLPGFLANSCT